jgi:hypothetical protein
LILPQFGGAGSISVGRAVFPRGSSCYEPDRHPGAVGLALSRRIDYLGSVCLKPKTKLVRQWIVAVEGGVARPGFRKNAAARSDECPSEAG